MATTERRSSINSMGLPPGEQSSSKPANLQTIRSPSRTGESCRYNSRPSPNLFCKDSNQLFVTPVLEAQRRSPMSSLTGGMLFVLMTFGWMFSGGNLFNNWGQGLTTMLSTPPWGPAASSWSPGVPRPSRGLEVFSMILRLGNYYTPHYDREEDFEVKYGDWVPGKHRIRVRGKRAAMPYKPGPQKCLQLDQGREGVYHLEG